MESQQGGGQCSHWQNWWFILMIGDMEFHGIPSRKDHFLGKPNHEVSIWIELFSILSFLGYSFHMYPTTTLSVLSNRCAVGSPSLVISQFSLAPGQVLRHVDAGHCERIIDAITLGLAGRGQIGPGEFAGTISGLYRKSHGRRGKNMNYYNYICGVLVGF